jgi:SSS family solute:Na+ symporter
MDLTFIDVLVILIPLGIVLSFSIYLKRYMRSVADFLAANRCAGRYLISTAVGETGASVFTMITTLELFSKTGWSLNFWNVFSDVAFVVLGILGIVGYRYRQTRSLTFHQFFEVRYSKGVRAFASFLNAFSGLLTFGVQPAIGARFFIYFCGIHEFFKLGGLTVPSFLPVMIVLMGMSLYFALTGGQISVIVTDCLEGVISSMLWLVVAGFLIYTISVSQLRMVMLSGPPGGSYVDPFDIGSRSDFNGSYVAFALLLNMYRYRGNAWNQGFAAAAKSPHEIRMAGILGNWRDYSYKAMTALIALGGFTLLHHVDFAAKQAVVEHTLAGMSMPQLRSQMRMPVAIGALLAPGVKGCFCAVLLFGLLAGQGQQLHSYGSTFLQDVFLPFMKPLSPKAHVRALKLMVFGVATFACLFSLWFKPVDYLILATALLGSLYMGGIGLVVWGGLYSKRATTAGAWTSLLIGSIFSAVFFIFQQYWADMHPTLVRWAGSGSVGNYLAAHVDRCPLNGQQLSVVTAVCSAIGFVVVSWLTRQEDFNLDAMLHRGAYQLPSEETTEEETHKNCGWLARMLDVNEHFTRSDRVLTYGTFVWSMSWQGITMGILFWTLVVGRLSPNAWFDYQLYLVIGVGLVLAVPTTIWFTIGVTKDLIELIRTLKTARRSDADDGTVRDHHNADENELETV